MDRSHTGIRLVELPRGQRSRGAGRVQLLATVGQLTLHFAELGFQLSPGSSHGGKLVGEPGGASTQSLRLRARFLQRGLVFGGSRRQPFVRCGKLPSRLLLGGLRRRETGALLDKFNAKSGKVRSRRRRGSGGRREFTAQLGAPGTQFLDLERQTPRLGGRVTRGLQIPLEDLPCGGEVRH